MIYPDPYGGEQEDPAYRTGFECTCGARCADDCQCEDFTKENAEAAEASFQRWAKQYAPKGVTS